MPACYKHGATIMPVYTSYVLRVWQVQEDRRSLVARFSSASRPANAPHSPVTFVVLRGRGLFAGGDEREHELGPNALVVLNPGENHAVRALDDDLVFVAILHGSPWSE